MIKFNRNYRLTIQTNEIDEVVIIEPPMTVEFNINRSTMASVNDMTINVYNLSESTRNKLFQDKFNPKVYKRIMLEAGYNDNLSVCFIGNIFYCYSQRRGTEIVTEINARDGAWDAINSLSGFTANAGVSQKDLINMLLGDFTNVSKGEIGDFGGKLSRGASMNGNTYDLINRYSNGQTFIDLEKVNVLNDNEVLKGEVVVIDSETGLLNTPKREETYLEVDILFESRIVVGQVVELASSVQNQYNGQYKVIGIKHHTMISEAQCGQAITTLSLLMQSQLLGAFNQVENGQITPLNYTGDWGQASKVREFIIANNTPPKWKITRQIHWHEVLVDYPSMGSVPSVGILANLSTVAKKLQNLVDTNFPGRSIFITSGWRSVSYEHGKHRGCGSYHTKGQALDFNLSGVSSNAVQNKINSVWSGGMEWANGWTHVDTGPNRRFNQAL